MYYSNTYFLRVLRLSAEELAEAEHEVAEQRPGRAQEEHVLSFLFKFLLFIVVCFLFVCILDYCSSFVILYLILGGTCPGAWPPSASST